MTALRANKATVEPTIPEKVEEAVKVRVAERPNALVMEAILIDRAELTHNTLPGISELLIQAAATIRSMRQERRQEQQRRLTQAQEDLAIMRDPRAQDQTETLVLEDDLKKLT